MWYRQLLIISLAMCLVTTTSYEALAQDKGEAVLASVLDEVINAVPSAQLSSWGTSEEENLKWTDLVVQCQESFARLLGRSDERLLVYKFVSEFGEHGPNADFAILVALGRYGIPAPSGGTSLISAESPEHIKVDLFRHRQLLVAECQTRIFLKHPEKMHRYLCFLLWAGVLDETGYRRYKESARTAMTTGDYWWHARNALVLMTINGEKVDQIKNPDAIYEAYVEWLDHVTEFDLNLVSVEIPFEDWTGVTPMSRRAYRQIYD